MIGAIRYTHKAVRLPETTAGANERAGFMDAPEIGPANRASKAITPPTAIPAISPFSFAPLDTARITNINMLVRMISSTKDCQAAPDGKVAPRLSCVGNNNPQHGARCKRSRKLTQNVWHDGLARKSFGNPETYGYSRIEMSTGHVANGVDHRHDDKAECQGHAHMGDLALTDIVDDDCARSRKDEAERANDLCG